MTPIDMSKWVQERLQGLSPTKKQQATKNTEGLRNSLTHKRTYQLILRYQMVSNENINIHDIIQTKKAIFNKIYV